MLFSDHPAQKGKQCKHERIAKMFCSLEEASGIINIMHEYITQKYFVNNPDKPSTEFYNKLKKEFDADIEFEEIYRTHDDFSPGETLHNQGKWIIRVYGRPHKDFNFERVLAHELLHVFLRYRNKLPWPDQISSRSIQVKVINIIDHVLINPELDKLYGNRTKENINPDIKKISKEIEPFLKIVTEKISREEYVEILRKCLSVLNEKMPPFVL
ncbi:MAG: hypothetical protein P9L93_05130 [Candidatus Gorgyraea atricola]|nr:hypothetical protein [Candidatus Gorgyraea atricola]